MTPEEFQARFMPYAQQVSARTGLDPRLVLSQAALETGWGRSAPNNNFFGIKSHGQAGGNTLMTQEFQNGRMVSIPQSFRGYESPEQSFQGYADFILSNPRYQSVLSRGDLAGQIEAMGQSGYATDPEYANKLASIAARFGGDTPRGVAADTRAALGIGGAPEQVSTRGPVPMMPQREEPQGLLQMLGIQPRGEGPQGDRPFYQRDQFRDTAGRLAIAANSLRQRPDQSIPQMVQGNRMQREANRTAEWLGQQEGGAEFAQAILNGANPGEVLMAYRQSRQPVAPEQTAAMQNYQFLLAQGVDPATAMERAFSGSGTNIEISGIGAQQDAFSTETGKRIAQESADIAAQGAQASRSLVQINQLDRILSNVDTGAGAAFTAALGDFGIQLEGADEVQAARAIINQLVPQQRPPGSGPMSDADLELFKQSLPRIINSPDGNKRIIDMMRAIANYDVERGRIARLLQDGEITRQEARQRYDALDNPLASIRDSGGASSGVNAPPEAVQMLKTNPTPAAMAQFDEIFGAGAAALALGQ